MLLREGHEFTPADKTSTKTEGLLVPDKLREGHEFTRADKTSKKPKGFSP
jgi:hypothetical protein